MATLTVRNLDDDIVRRLRIRAAEHGLSAEAEHREILRATLVEGASPRLDRQAAAARLADFRRRIVGRESASSAALLEATRAGRMRALAGEADGV